MPPPYNQKYIPPVPFPFMCGYLEKSTGDHTTPLKSQTWKKKYVEVSDGNLRFFTLREEREETGVVIPLSEAFVSIQAKRHIRLETKAGIRI
uniref:PH domain-containing protein n=1 Tax=Ciona savignyi TaxID=51511 RepID=H2YJT5_CIOSA